MVCIRCKMVVKSEIENLSLQYETVELGVAIIRDPVTSSQLKELDVALKRSGLEIMDDKKNQLMEKIKNIVVEMIHYTENRVETKFSEYLSSKLHYDYKYLSNLFALTQGTTLEHFIIFHKIEKVKELLVYDELTLTEISYKMNYSSVAHLSNQFKKTTGLTPSHFKKLKEVRFKDDNAL